MKQTKTCAVVIQPGFRTESQDCDRQSTTMVGRDQDIRKQVEKILTLSVLDCTFSRIVQSWYMTHLIIFYS